MEFSLQIMNGENQITIVIYERREMCFSKKYEEFLLEHKKAVGFTYEQLIINNGQS